MKLMIELQQETYEEIKRRSLVLLPDTITQAELNDVFTAIKNGDVLPDTEK